MLTGFILKCPNCKKTQQHQFDAELRKQISRLRVEELPLHLSHPCQGCKATIHYKMDLRAVDLITSTDD